MPATDASTYCDHCGHQHRAGSRCRIRDGYGDRCNCPGHAADPEDGPPSNTRHVHPADDGIEHDTSTSEPDCLCGPEVRPAPGADGSMGWLIVHHSLDGREQAEA